MAYGRVLRNATEAYESGIRDHHATTSYVTPLPFEARCWTAFAIGVHLAGQLDEHWHSGASWLS